MNDLPIDAPTEAGVVASLAQAATRSLDVREETFNDRKVLVVIGEWDGKPVIVTEDLGKFDDDPREGQITVSEQCKTIEAFVDLFVLHRIPDAVAVIKAQHPNEHRVNVVAHLDPALGTQVKAGRRKITLGHHFDPRFTEWLRFTQDSYTDVETFGDFLLDHIADIREPSQADIKEIAKGVDVAISGQAGQQADRATGSRRQVSDHQVTTTRGDLTRMTICVPVFLDRPDMNIVLEVDTKTTKGDDPKVLRRVRFPDLPALLTTEVTALHADLRRALAARATEAEPADFAFIVGA